MIPANPASANDVGQAETLTDSMDGRVGVTKFSRMLGHESVQAKERLVRAAPALDKEQAAVRPLKT
jgi:hypothetical protein